MGAKQKLLIKVRELIKNSEGVGAGSQKDATLTRLQELLNNRRTAYAIAGEEIDTTFMTTSQVADKLKDAIVAKINM